MRKFVFTSAQLKGAELRPLFGVWKKEDGLVDEEKQESLDALKTQTMTPEDWDKLLGGAKKTTYTKGQAIISAGDPFQSLYQIEKGACDVVVPIGEGLYFFFFHFFFFFNFFFNFFLFQILIFIFFFFIFFFLQEKQLLSLNLKKVKSLVRFLSS